MSGDEERNRVMSRPSLCVSMISKEIRSFIRVLLRFCTVMVSLTACQQGEESAQGKNSTSPSIEANAPKAYTPPVGYTASSGDPLAALYGGTIQSATGSNQPRGLNNKALQSRFDKLKPVPLDHEFPTKWRRALKGLNEQIPLKVTSWRSKTTTRMERGQRDREIYFKLRLLGTKSDVQHLAPQALRKVKEFRVLPKKLGDQHEHIAEKGRERLLLNYSAIKSIENKVNPVLLATLKISWNLKTPEPRTLDKNCRYVHGLPQSMGEARVPWAKRRFRSTSTRRFVEWYVERSKEGLTWRATWIYRNGSYRDKAVGWWTDKLNAKSATQTSLAGMEQTWALSDGETLQWWPESDPSSMGCKIAGPLLSISTVAPTTR